MTRIFVDPGDKTGVAVFERTRLQAAYTVAFKEFTVWQPWVLTQAIIETPVYRRNDRVDPNKIIALARKVGWLERGFSEFGVPVKLVKPHEWKGSMPKSVTKARALRVLTEAELGVIDPKASHDAWDAIAMGLWYHGLVPGPGRSSSK